MKVLLKKIGPGLLFAGASIGVSHLVQSTRAGAEFGLGLLWALLFINLFKYPFFQFGPRYAAASGESLIEGYRKLGKAVLIIYFLIMLCTMFTIQTAVTIVTAGLASTLFGATIEIEVWTVVILVICLLILIIGKYKLLDNLMKIIIITLSISTFLAVFMAFKNHTETLSLNQILPTDKMGIAFLIAFMGWMPSPIDISIFHSLWVVEKRKETKNFKTKSAILDFNIGYIGTIILGAAFILLGALVMFQSGETLGSSATEFSNQLINMYASQLGDWAYVIIGISAFTTMFSTTLTTLDASPRAMARTSSILFGKTKLNYAFWMALLIIGTILIFFFLASEMGLLIQIATVLSFLTAPFYAIINYRLISSKYMPKKWRPSKMMHVWSWSGILFLIGFSLWFLYSLF